MEKAARRFTTWVLGLHLLVLALLVVIVIFSSSHVYSSARRQALDQVKVRQELLAQQTARGIEQHCRGVVEELELYSRLQARGPNVTSLIWERLQGRATRLIEVRGRLMRDVVFDFGDDAKTSAAEILKQAGPDLLNLRGLKVTDTYNFNGTVASLIALPIGADAAEPRALIALVPARGMGAQFLNDLNEPANISSMLVDNRLSVVAAEDRDLVGLDIGKSADARVALVATEYREKGQRGTREFLEPFRMGNVQMQPAMVSMQPVDMPDGTKWWLCVSSTLAEVDTAVGAFFRRVAIGAGLVILAMTAVLVSTSTQIIRGRLRLERVQREMMSRELEQAREIQLLWLPERQGTQMSIDIAAVNRPASHISGDFYNWFELPDGRACVVIGDVTGHGLPAAFLMATTQLLVRTIITRVSDPGQCLRETNRQLCTHVFSGQFVTLLVMVIDAETGVVELATAGHPPPFVGSGDAFAALPVESQLVLAVDNDVAYRTQRFELKPGTSVVLFTDGVTDVQAPLGERLGTEGMEKSLFGSFTSAQTLLNTVLDTIESFRAGREPADDLTLVAVQLPPPAAPDAQPAPLAAARTA